MSRRSRRDSRYGTQHSGGILDDGLVMALVVVMILAVLAVGAVLTVTQLRLQKELHSQQQVVPHVPRH